MNQAEIIQNVEQEIKTVLADINKKSRFHHTVQFAADNEYGLYIVTVYPHHRYHRKKLSEGIFDTAELCLKHVERLRKKQTKRDLIC